MAKNKGVYVAVLNQGWVRPELAALMAELPYQNKYNIYVTYPAGKPITHNRNTIVKKFLETDYDYLLMIDGDCIPPADILEMADYDKDVIGALAYGYLNKMLIPFCMKKNDEGTYDIADTYESSGVVECDAVGSGVMMIRRDILEDIPFPFRNEYDPEGIKTKGLDFNFCERAKKKGYKIFCHTDFKCSHWTTLDLKTIHQTYQQIKKEAIMAIKYKNNDSTTIPKNK